MKISILNLAPLRQGQNFKDAIDAMVKLAKKDMKDIGLQNIIILKV